METENALFATVPSVGPCAQASLLQSQSVATASAGNQFTSSKLTPGFTMELPPGAHPWLLSTDKHLMQGGVELQHVRYDPSTEELAGTAGRHRARSATGKFGEQVEASGAKILHLDRKFQESMAS